jgi:hypothetical protein
VAGAGWLLIFIRWASEVRITCYLPCTGNNRALIR